MLAFGEVGGIFRAQRSFASATCEFDKEHIWLPSIFSATHCSCTRHKNVSQIFLSEEDTVTYLVTKSYAPLGLFFNCSSEGTYTCENFAGCRVPLKVHL